jgi:hypothetical protein
MVSLTALVLPILVAAVLVFIASSLIHMLLPFHRADYGKLPSEDKVMDALRPFNIPSGDYLMPCPGGPESMKDPAFIAKRKAGPVALMTFWPSGDVSMAPMLVQWFVFCLVVGLFSGYLTSRALPVGAPYLEVFRFAGTVAFVGYGLALWEHSIWYHKGWAITFRSNIDALIYGLLTGGAFGWLWPS